MPKNYSIEIWECNLQLKIIQLHKSNNCKIQVIGTTTDKILDKDKKNMEVAPK